MNTITDAQWERANLVLTPQFPIEYEAYLLDRKNKRYDLPVRNGKIILNVTNLSKGEMIDEGQYRLYIDEQRALISDDILKNINYFTRVFKYRKGRYALITELKTTKKFYFNINATYMIKNKHYKRNFRFGDAKTLKGKGGVIVKTLFPVLIHIFYSFISIFKPKSSDRVLFFSENDDEPRGNLKVLFEYFINNKLGNTKGVFYNKFKKKPRLSIADAVIKIALSDIIVVDNYSPLLNSLTLRKNQKIVQLWHAGVGFKAVGYARFGEAGSPHPTKSSHRKYTTVIVDDERLIDIYKEVFGVDGEICKALGMPRLEGYLSKERIDETVKRLYTLCPELDNKKIILFSPTFRGVGAQNAYYNYSELDLAAIYKYCIDNNFIFLVKMHPFVKTPIDIPEEYSHVIKDFFDYDINDLIYIADIMITDYSSCAYEYSFFNRPLVFFRYDKSMYEYSRPVHTLDAFTQKQYEVTEFNGLMDVLNTLKDIKPEERFSDMRKRDNECCSKIAREILGDNN